MTHTLHRKAEIPGEAEDFTILCMATQGFNDKGAGEKLKKIYQLVAATHPDNLADDNLGGRYTGHTDEEIMDHMGDKAYVGAAFSDRKRLALALTKIKEADLGMSVVVTGDYKTVFDVLRQIGLRPHTVNMSLGVFGNEACLPSKETLSVATMCGHGMVTRRRIEEASEKVRSKEVAFEKAARDLACTCTCGIFNPVLAARLLAKNIE
jgi:hypothetical protein